jgi:CRP-like cAMP-binding protein
MTDVRALTNTSLFKSLTDAQIKAVIQLAEEKAFEPGAIIFTQGQDATTLYVLLSGSVCLKIRALEELDPLAEILKETGSIFGLPALSKLRRYDVTAKCIDRARTLAMDSTKLNQIVRKDPVAGLEVMAELAQLYLNRLNSTRMGMRNLLRIFRSQGQRTPLFGVYRDPE